MKKNEDIVTELIEEYHILVNSNAMDFKTLKETSMFMVMSEKYGKIPEDRNIIIQSLKERIEILKDEQVRIESLEIVKGIKKGDVKTYPIDTLWKEL